MKFEPLLDRVLVKLDEQSDTRTKGGLYIPSSAKPRANSGVVTAVGGGRQNTDGSWRLMTLKEGDKVLLPEYSGVEVELDEGKFLLFLYDEILGVLKETQKDDEIPF